MHTLAVLPALRQLANDVQPALNCAQVPARFQILQDAADHLAAAADAARNCLLCQPLANTARAVCLRLRHLLQVLDEATIDVNEGQVARSKSSSDGTGGTDACRLLRGANSGEGKSGMAVLLAHWPGDCRFNFNAQESG